MQSALKLEVGAGGAPGAAGGDIGTALAKALGDDYTVVGLDRKGRPVAVPLIDDERRAVPTLAQQIARIYERDGCRATSMRTTPPRASRCCTRPTGRCVPARRRPPPPAAGRGDHSRRRAGGARLRGAVGRDRPAHARRARMDHAACAQAGREARSGGAARGRAAAFARPRIGSDTIRAVVSRGRRPDLAGETLAKVHAPTLLIVGGDDVPVIGMKPAHAGE